MASRCIVRGSINVDEFFHVKHIVYPGETISSHELSKRAGGKGANQAVAVAKAGASVVLVGSVGEDGFWVVEYLKDSGVDVSDIQTVSESTGRAVIQLTDDGQNSIILFKGANYSTHPKKSIPSGATHILLQNEIPFNDTLAYLNAAAEASLSTVTIFNPSPMPSNVEIKAFPWDKLAWLVVNEGEASNLYQALSNGTPDIPVPDCSELACANLSAYPTLVQLSSQIPKINIVCTLGAAGVLALIPSLRKTTQVSSSLHSDPIFLPAVKLKNSVVDTTGAGDCFTGYLVAGLMEMHDKGAKVLQRQDVIYILKRCVQAAGMCVEKRGAMESIPLARDIV
ncbi:Ribokinase-like protein [Lentinula aciculospora]|uniref:Ribokinase n=1 Tax=Lentinula aciculospora TaxID=153920 RepID=A0A9W9AER7_9AGAR|nr:Ribokinase-like protein [Lentinula aciculospora]